MGDGYNEYSYMREAASGRGWVCGPIPQLSLVSMMVTKGDVCRTSSCV
jgi:hypothetical protein